MNHPDRGLNNYLGSVQPKSFPPFASDWDSEWETFPSSDGLLQLYSVVHHPKVWTGPRVLAVFHGLGEHGGRYLHFAHYLRNSVDAIYCMDHRGHGRSEGIRGHVERFDLFVDDVALALSRLDEQLKKRFGQSEIHVLGHSMGGLVLLRTLFKHHSLPIHSATVSAPLLGVKVDINPIKKGAAYLLSRVWGSLHMNSEVDPTLLSHDQDVVDVYRLDRLVHQKGTPRLYTEMQAAISDTLRRDVGIFYPLQMLIPLSDRIVDSEAAIGFFRKLKHRDKQLKTYPGVMHEPFNDTSKEQVFEDLTSWIKKHTPNSTSSLLSD